MKKQAQEMLETKKTIFETVKILLLDISGKDISCVTINDSTDIINDIGLNSLQVISMILRIEEELDIEFDFDKFDYSHLSTVAQFCKYIAKQSICD